MIVSKKIAYLNDRLVNYECVDIPTRHICKIVVPESLERNIFPLINALIIVEHVVECKTLHKCKLVFFWPKVKRDVSPWVRAYTH